MLLKTLFAFLCALSPILAKDFGVHGTLFEILEEDLLKSFSKGLKNPEEEKQEAWRKKLEEKVKRPTPVSGLLETKQYKSFEFDPTLVVEEDIVDDRGNVLAKKGDKINPCSGQEREGGFLFFDGDQNEHVLWAETHEDNFQWVLTRGSPIELEEILRKKNVSKSVFFDQGGVYTKHFGIKNVPCRMMQKGEKIVIEEIPIKRKKNV